MEVSCLSPLGPGDLDTWTEPHFPHIILLFCHPSLRSADTSLDGITSNTNRVHHQLEPTTPSWFIFHPCMSALLSSAPHGLAPLMPLQPASCFISLKRRAPPRPRRQHPRHRESWRCGGFVTRCGEAERRGGTATTAFLHSSCPPEQLGGSASPSCGRHRHTPTLCCFPYSGGG